MRKLLFLIPIFLFGITTYPDFSLCYKKYKNYTIIPISKSYSITAIPQKNFIKYDEDLGIYLIKRHNKHPIYFHKAKLGIWIASISKNSIYAGNYAEYQKSVYNPAKISTKATPGSIVTDIFCRPIGIGVRGGFLSHLFVQKFIVAHKRDKNFLKFMGIIFNKQLIVTKILPDSLAAKYYLYPGAKIIAVNNKPVYGIDDIDRIHQKEKIKQVTLYINGIRFTLKANYDKL